MTAPWVLEFGRVGVETHTVTSGEDIRRARELAGLTQEEVARRVGVSINTVSNWERDVSRPRGKEALLRQVLDMDSDVKPPATDTGPLLRDASSAELLAELARRMERDADDRRPVTELPTGRYRMRKSAGPSVRASQEDEQDKRRKGSR